MKIALGNDHAGTVLKAELLELLRAKGHEILDFGTNTADPVDYPDFIRPAAEAVARGDADRGIVIGGSGNGEAMAANKVPGARSALCHDVTTARLSRLHNDANLLSMGARIVGSQVWQDVVTAWLETEFSGDERHARRIEKIRQMESEYGSRLDPS
jgi:ribose 5-phosphate isomerase B